MSQCSATIKAGPRCLHNAREGFTTCGKHVSVGRAVYVTRCTLIKTDGRRCTRTSSNGGVCAFHSRMQLWKAAEDSMDEVWADILDLIWGIGNPPAVAEDLYQLTEERLLLSPYRETQLVVLRVQIDRELVYYNRRDRVVLKGDLHRIALDAQSVHTRDVSNQTNEGMKKILEANDNMAESDKDVLSGVYAVLNAEKTCKDVKRWFDTVSCRENGDRLYRKCLRGVWALINESAHFDELCKRFVEECKESVGMCCEGHISRLCNVLVGFDDAFVAPVPVGEILQQKIAVIAAKDVSVEHKVGEAWRVFEELKIPMAERMPWLEAF